MYRKINDIQLRTGESVELGVVTAPDMEWGRKLCHLLGSKEARWLWQVDQILGNPACGVEGYFYVLLKNGRPFSNIATAETHGIGIFGHVFTTPEERKKGAADILHNYQMEDFKARGGRALYLGTTYNSPAYRLYQKYGFVGSEPQGGAMYYFTHGQETFEAEVFQPAAVTLESFAYKHWPSLSALAMKKHPTMLRILGMDITEALSSEAGSLPFLMAMHENNRSFDAQLAISNVSHVPVAIACRRLEPSFGSQVDLLDVFAAQGHEKHIPLLVESLKLDQNRKAICYADAAWPAKIEALKRAGFRLDVTLENHFRSHSNEVHNLTLWVKGR